jgi:hypothetical protein
MEIYVMHNGQQLGPFPLENVWAQLESGELSPADYAWGAEIQHSTCLRDIMSHAVRAQPTHEVWPTQKLTGRIRTAVRAITSFVDRQVTTKKLIAATVLLLIASWVYPPWIVDARSHGWFFVFDTTHSLEMRVDVGRLVLIDAIIAAIGGLVAWAAFHNSKPLLVAVRLAFYSLLVAAPIAVICLGTFLVHGHVTNKGSFNPFAYIGAVPVGGSPSPKDEWGVLLDTGAAQVNPVPIDELVIEPTDLKKITLFDVGVHGYKNSITGIYGRIRNRLANAVQRIGVKACFYTSEGELIEVRTFLMRSRAGVSWDGRVFPNAPVSFDEHLLVDHLPEGYKYQLEVTEARYAN